MNYLNFHNFQLLLKLNYFMIPVSWRKPSKEVLARRLKTVSDQSYGYATPGTIRRGTVPPGYDHDNNRYRLGRGKACFELTKKLLDTWQMFPASWTQVHGPDRPAVGNEVVVVFRFFGLWWQNACRIVYRIDTPVAYGFAYGTLLDHVERGEELFVVEMDATGAVWFRIEAVSRPNRWYVRLGYLFARAGQRRFVRDSFTQMQRLVQQQLQAATHG